MTAHLSPRALATLVLSALLLVAIVTLGGPAFAAGDDSEAPAFAPAGPVIAPPLGRFELTSSSSGGPLELEEHDGVLTASLVVHNTGSTDISITRLVVTGAGPDAAAPGVEATFEDGRPNAHLAVGASRAIVVRWDPSQAPRLRQIYALVTLESASVDPRFSSIGIHAERQMKNRWLFGRLLSWMTFLPLLAALLVAIGKLTRLDLRRASRWLLFAIMAVEVGLAAWLFFHFDASFGKIDGNDGYQLIERHAWIPTLGAEYFVGVDGISFGLVLVTALVGLAGALASLSEDDLGPGYVAMYCLLFTGLTGVFVALDALLFFVFWQIALAAAAMLVGTTGGERRARAASKLALFGATGAVLMLIGFVALYQVSDPAHLVDGSFVSRTFSLPAWVRVDLATKPGTVLGLPLVKGCWVALFVAFAIQVPVFPLHTWLLDVAVAAKGPVGAIVVALLIEMGAYGLLRVGFMVLPEGAAWGAPTMAALGTVGILHGAFCALAERDLRRLIAYASISHMGFCLLAMSSLTRVGLDGCVIQLLSHAPITATLLLLVDALAKRAGPSDRTAIGGLAGATPVLTGFLTLALLASLGMPGLSGFVGQLMALIGAFPVYRGLTVLGALGTIVFAAAHVSAIHGVLAGKPRTAHPADLALADQPARRPPVDLTWREALSVLPLVALIVALGVAPGTLLQWIDRGVGDLFDIVSPEGPTRITELDDAATRRPSARRTGTREPIRT